MISSQVSNDLFNKIRSKFGNITTGNTMGEPTADPKEAVFFDFEFKEDSDTFGRVSVSIADGETVKVYYNRGLVEKIDEESKNEWYAFLKELKDFAVTHQLGFDVRDITKNNLTKQDFKNLADTNQTVNTNDMSEEINRIAKLAGIQEGLTGTSKSSFENLDKTRLIIRHSKPVAEEVPGARTRHINSLYIENSDGERFKYPIVHLAGARAMTRHVANGGVPHDDFGQHIIKMSEQIAQLNSFNRYVSTKDQLNDSAGDIIERAKSKCESLKKYMKNISKQSHYEAAKENFQPQEMPILDDETKSSLQDKFTLKHFDEKVDSALPLINSIMQEFDKEEKPLSKKDIEIPTAVDGGNETLKFLASDQPLVLKKDPAADMMVFRSEFKDKKEMLRTVLMDIAGRLLPTSPDSDKVANFASSMANDLSKMGDAFGDVSTGATMDKDVDSKNFKKDLSTAYKLATRYVQDTKRMRQDPEFAATVRKDPQEVKAKVDRQGRAKEGIEAFENWANRIEARITEGTWSLPNEETAGDNFDQLKELMSKHFPVGNDAVNSTSILSDLGFGDDELYDDLGRLADEEGPEACARQVVHNYIVNKLLKSPRVGDYYSPEQQEDLKNAVHSNANDFMKEPMTQEDIKPYVSMYSGDDGKTVYDVLDKDGNSAYKTPSYSLATGFLKKNYEKLRSIGKDDVNENPEADQEMQMDYEFTGDDGETAQGTLYYKVVNGQVDPNSLRGESEYEGNAKVDDEFATDMVKPGGYEHEEALDAAQDDYDYESKRMQSKFGEGNEFALAVQKAKAAGMKAGDKFKVGDKEYTLKDAIEMAGLQLDEFFAEAEYAEPSKEHYKKACEAGFKGSYEDYKKEYASFPEEFPKNEAEAEPTKCDHCDGKGKHSEEDCKKCGGRGYITEAKPDFLDLDKDGNKKEPMKKAAKDADKTNEVVDILKLAGVSHVSH